MKSIKSQLTVVECLQGALELQQRDVVRQFRLEGVVGMDDGFLGPHNVVGVVGDVPDEDVEDTEAIDAVGGGDDPGMVHDAAATRKARERLLALSAEDFDGVRKAQRRLEPAEHFDGFVLDERTASGFENRQNRAACQVQKKNHKRESHRRLLWIY